MECSTCRSNNDNDAAFCEQCGRPLAAEAQVRPCGRGRAVLYGAAVCAFIALLAFGYVRFILPSGVAAEVNGETILLAEVDAVLAGSRVPPSMKERARYRALSDLIFERIAWQEARQAGIRATAGEIDAAYGSYVATLGPDAAQAEEQVRIIHGSKGQLRRVLERRVVIRKYIDGTITAGSRSDAEAAARVDQWMKGSVSRAQVKIALAEQVPGGSKPGCGCCNGPAKQDEAQPADPKLREAQKAALSYWRERSGGEDIEARAKDFGCHVQVDIIRNNRIARSLRYQNGTITEM